MNQCDLQIVLGAWFSMHTGIEQKKTTIQIGYEQMALGKLHPVAFPVWGEIHSAVSEICRQLPTSIAAHIAAQDQAPELQQRWQIWRQEKISREQDDRG